MSGGVLSSNPIGASGLIRCLEAANQVRGTAGDYQVDGAKVALGHAYGGAAQYFAMWIVSSELNPTFKLAHPHPTRTGAIRWVSVTGVS